MSHVVRVFIQSYAKLNFTLEVIGKRSDGYHELVSVMQTISLHDTIALTRDDSALICLSCDAPDLASETNLALRAAKALAEAFPRQSHGVSIELHKEIPSQAGLGGGSANAATVFAVLNRLWRLHLNDQQLMAFGATLGSDVPFLMRGGTALIRGRGEDVSQLPDADPLWFVLARPTRGFSTAEVFTSLRPTEYSGGGVSDRLSQSISAGEPLVPELFVNDLEKAAFRLYPEASAIASAVHAAGAPVVRMSGSGSTFFAPFRELAEAAHICQTLRNKQVSCRLAHSVSASHIESGLAVVSQSN